MALGKLGKYERVDVLGHGVSGIVYLAWDTLLKKQVALKEIDLQAADVDRFLEEARVMDRLSHTGIVRVNGVDRIDGRVVIDMEYVKGENLQDLLRREGRLPIDRAVQIAIQTLDALHYAHEMRTVHRDVKPANILVSRSGEVKLVDFGLAEILATNSYAGGAGTYAYMAPEDFAEEHRSDHQSDIWAVGVTLFEMLTAARPFVVAKTKDPFAWRRVLLEEAPARLSEYLPEAPAALQTVLDRALAKDKQARYATAAQFRDDLRAIAEAREPVYAAAIGAAASATVTATAAPLPSPLAPPRYPEPDPVPTASLPAAQPEAEEAVRPGAGGRLPLLARRKAVVPAQVGVAPPEVHFGEVRKGDERAARITVRFTGGEGKVFGRVADLPPWIDARRTEIDRRRQAMTFVARSDRVWQTGECSDSILLKTSAGDVRVPVHIRVLKPRPRFTQVALWLIPLFVSVLMPAFTVALNTQGFAARELVPTAALASGLLAAMLLLVTVEADLGFAERLAAGVLLAVLTMVLGVTVGVALRAGGHSGITSLIATAVPFGGMLFCQLLSRRYWKVWGVVIVVLAALASGTFATALSG